MCPKECQPSKCYNIGQIIDEFTDHRHSMLAMCKLLESVADGLPNSVDPQDCLTASRLLPDIVHSAHGFEEAAVFPAIYEVAETKYLCMETINRLIGEHWEDECCAIEVSEALREFADDSKDANFESLAYLLRGFFEGIRRHTAFETEYILPKLKKIMAG